MSGNKQFWEVVDGIRANLKNSDLDDAQSIAATINGVRSKLNSNSAFI